mgnify:CR=1 FL=1
MPDTSATEENSGLPLADAIRQLRAELLAATEEGEGQALRFTVESVELELNLVLDTRKKLDGRFSVWRVSAGAGRERGRQETHRMTLKLKPQRADGEKPDVTISGDGEY